MKPSRRIPLLVVLAVGLALPGLAAAQDAAPAAPAAAPESAMPAPMGGMGMQMRRGMGGEPCPMHKGGMQGGDAPCMMGQGKGCRMAGGDLDDKRLDALEKRMDMMQLMLETLLKQQRPAARTR